METATDGKVRFVTVVQRALAMLLAVMLAAGPALAQPAAPSKADVKKAEELFSRANQRYEAGEYATAAEDFRAAYDLSKLTALLFNVAQAYRLDGNCPEALKYYREYLVAEPQTKNRVDVEARVGQMERCVAEQEQAPPPPPIPEPVPLPLPPPPPPVKVIEGPRPGRGLRIGGLTLAGLGLAAGGVGVFFAMRAKSAASDVSDACRETCHWDDLQAKDDAGRRDGKLSLILWGAGGGLLVTGTVLFAIGMSKKGKKVEAVTVMPVPGGAWAGVTGRF
jgi:tetratricopeptide (TPR) repeat protein